MQRYDFQDKYFNTILHVTIFSSEEQEAKFIYQQLKLKCARLHQLFNYYDNTSQLSILNQNKELIINDDNFELLEIIKEAKNYHRWTNYYFNIDTTFINEETISIENNLIKIQNPLDLGAIAKGYFLDWCSSFLKPYSNNIFINFGGAVLSHQAVLQVGIKNPLKKEENALVVAIGQDFTIHTSASYEQINQKGESHIYLMNNENHYQALIGRSITVIDKNSVLCDCLSTALFSMELELAIGYIKDHKVNAIIIDNDTLYVYKTLKDSINTDNFKGEVVII